MINSLHYVCYCFNISHPVTQTTLAERDVLKRYARGKKRLAEIGIFHGVNTRKFREVMDPDGVIIAVDPFKRTFFGIRGYGWARRIAHSETRKVKRGSVIWVEDFGHNVPFNEKVAQLLHVDFLFIDGDH